MGVIMPAASSTKQGQLTLGPVAEGGSSVFSTTAFLFFGDVGEECP